MVLGGGAVSFEQGSLVQGFLELKDTHRPRVLLQACARSTGPPCERCLASFISRNPCTRTRIFLGPYTGGFRVEGVGVGVGDLGFGVCGRSLQFWGVWSFPTVLGCVVDPYSFGVCGPSLQVWRVWSFPFEGLESGHVGMCWVLVVEVSLSPHIGLRTKNWSLSLRKLFMISVGTTKATDYRRYSNGRSHHFEGCGV